MAGIAFDFRLDGLDIAIQSLDKFSAFQTSELLEQMGGLIETQTLERLDDTKQSPDGSEWDDWTDSYTQTRNGGHSLLDGEGNLINSITYIVGSDEVSVGSPLVYAAAHQFGNEANSTSARPYLGFSDDNIAEIELELSDFLRGAFQ
ncbi:MAG: phage virion morphogenesis protein [Hyphomicrobiales bacterium]|nr:MAG: phage virion morphogenesis protein [Hyphomicrobiales bacterium]